MRTTQAARYARWSVIMATMLLVTVGVVYFLRARQARQAEGAAPASVPAAVQQRSAEFSFSKVDGNRTQFVVRASHATEFKDGGRTVLDDVWITSYGGKGDRADQLRSQSCEYLAQSGNVTCPEQVLIDLQTQDSPAAGDARKSATSDPPLGAVHIVTSHLNFNRQTGVASSDEPVQFQFAQGEGRAVGVIFNSQAGELHLLHEVELVFRSQTADSEVQIGTSAPPSGDPMTISSAELFYRRDEQAIHLLGPARMRQGRQELQAGQMILEVDEAMHGKRLIARDHPVLHNPSDGSDVSLTADELTAPLSAGGKPSRVIATGDVALDALRTGDRNHLTAASAELALVPESQQPNHFTADGNVLVQSSLADGSGRRLQTSHLDVYFVPAEGGASRLDRATSAAGSIDWQSSPAASSHKDAESMRLTGRALDASFGESGELRELRGTGGVNVVRRVGDGSPMTSASRELTAHIAPDGLWSAVDQSGDVRLKTSNGDAQGDRAHFDNTGQSVTLTGSVLMTDASSQTRAQSATFLQDANQLRADGNIATTDLSANPSSSSGANSDPSHITSDHLRADTASGRAVYSGRARLWQGDSVVQADTINLARDTRILIATGNVRAVFPQTDQSKAEQSKTLGVSHPASHEPRLWHAEAPRMVYEDNAHLAHLEQGAGLTSADGTLRAQTIDLFFADPGASSDASGATSATSQRGAGPGLGAAFAKQQLQRAQALGGVRVENGDRTGLGERADYWVDQDKFVLSGGHPTLNDKSGNKTAGRQLTFFLADDKILVDSESGSRSLTLHQVEK